MIRVAVIGTGLIGRARLDAIAALRREGHAVEVVGVFDADAEVCRSAAEFNETRATTSVGELLDASPDWVMIALPHDVAAQVAEESLASGARVLLEKPMGRDLVEAERLLRAGEERLWIGLNYRFFRGIERAITDARAGRFGELISVGFEMGHGCAPGQEKTWKLDPERAGGGCLIDPGVHLLDLCLQLAPQGLTPIGGVAWDGFWKTGVEEEVSLLLDAGSYCMTVRVSLVSWRSTFHMRINGTEGYCTVTGRNRSYGPQIYTVGRRWGWRDAASQSDSETIEARNDGLDVFKRETETLLFPTTCVVGWPAVATAKDGYTAMKLLDEIRNSLRLRRSYARL